jgi:hypothetical protein
MNLHLAFQLFFAISGISWLLLIVFPRKRAINFWLCGTIVPSVIGAFYTILCAVYWFDAPGSFFDRFGSHRGMLSMFNSSEGLLLAGFVHYLAFDVFIGSWQARRATAAGWPYWLLFICLIVTLLFGPTGLLLFSVISLVRGQHVPEDEPIPRRAGYTSSSAVRP